MTAVVKHSDTTVVRNPAIIDSNNQFIIDETTLPRTRRWYDSKLDANEIDMPVRNIAGERRERANDKGTGGAQLRAVRN